MKKDVAMSFMWENESKGFKKVLFYLKWTSMEDYYFLNAGAYDQEEEILINDGTGVVVDKVEEIAEGGYTFISMHVG